MFVREFSGTCANCPFLSSLQEGREPTRECVLRERERESTSGFTVAFKPWLWCPALCLVDCEDIGEEKPWV